MSSDSLAIQRLSEYISIKTVHPNPDYEGAVLFLQKYAEELGLRFQLIRLSDHSIPAVILSWMSSTSKSAGSLLLNSHMDVVPVEGQKWSSDPFSLTPTSDGKMVGRGTQDMKSVGIQHLEAIRRLKQRGVRFDCDVHVSFVPDEEIGGANGMRLLCQMDEFKALNVYAALDEGIPSPFDIYALFTKERICKWIRIEVNSIGGHGSLPANPTFAVERFQRIYTKMIMLRTPIEDECHRSDQSVMMKLGEFTTVNCTKLNAGLQSNIIPHSVEATFDVRVPPERYESTMNAIKDILEAENGVSVLEGMDDTQMDNSNPEITKALTTIVSSAIGKPVVEMSFPGATDSRYLRETGIPCIGITPMINTQIKLHAEDEYCLENEFLSGINIFERLIAVLCDHIMQHGK